MPSSERSHAQSAASSVCSTTSMARSVNSAEWLFSCGIWSSQNHGQSPLRFQRYRASRCLTMAVWLRVWRFESRLRAPIRCISALIAFQLGDAAFERLNFFQCITRERLHRLELFAFHEVHVRDNALEA